MRRARPSPRPARVDRRSRRRRRRRRRRSPPQEVGIDEKLGETLPLDLVLHDEDGKGVSLRSLIDKPTLLTLNYFRCAGHLHAAAQRRGRRR